MKTEKEAFVPLTSDGIFKAFFSQKQFLKIFLEDVLKINIVSLDYLDTLMSKDFSQNKECRLDLIALLDDNTYINIEMQKANDSDIISRSHYYLNKIITRNLKEGEGYKWIEIKKFVALNILDYNDERFKKLHHICGICDLESKKQVSDIEEIHIISLNRSNMNDQKILDWIELFKEKDRWDMDKYKDKKLEKAVQELKRLSRDKEVMALYEQEQKALIDRSLIRDKGLKDGRKEGRIEGQKEAKKEAALNFYQNGVTKEIICKSLQISAKELEEILNEN